MRLFKSILAASVFALVACGQPAATSEAEAQTASTAATEVSAADRTAILRAAQLTADARGMVENECGEKVTPQLTPVDLGGAVGTAVLLAMSGGPNYASCYGDGPGLTMFKREGATWRPSIPAAARCSW